MQSIGEDEEYTQMHNLFAWLHVFVKYYLWLSLNFLILFQKVMK